MKISNAILAAAALSGSVSALSDEMVDRFERPRMPPNFQPISSAPEWHEACVKYNSALKRLVGVCDEGKKYVFTDQGKHVEAGCPEGSVSVLSSKPIAYCMQPAIL